MKLLKISNSMYVDIEKIESIRIDTDVYSKTYRIYFTCASAKASYTAESGAFASIESADAWLRDALQDYTIN